MTIIMLLLSLLLPPCATEDSVNCYWDASAQGNGQGSDIVYLEMP